MTNFSLYFVMDYSKEKTTEAGLAFDDTGCSGQKR
jgi:hypothetical protein